MKKVLFAAALLAMLTPATATFADPPAWANNKGGKDWHRKDWRGKADRRNDDRRGRDDWRQSQRYDYNRPDPRYGRSYDASRYYRDDTSYRERRLTRNDRIYRGNDGRYYCRRQDGTTGLIIGALAGGALGNVISNGNSSTLATLLGAAGGGLIGRSIDRGDARCR